MVGFNWVTPNCARSNERRGCLHETFAAADKQKARSSCRCRSRNHDTMRSRSLRCIARRRRAIHARPGLLLLRKNRMKRMVRRGLRPRLDCTRSASTTRAELHPLSSAPVPRSQESRCAEDNELVLAAASSSFDVLNGRRLLRIEGQPKRDVRRQQTGDAFSIFAAGDHDHRDAAALLQPRRSCDGERRGSCSRVAMNTIALAFRLDRASDERRSLFVFGEEIVPRSKKNRGVNQENFS